MFAKPLRRWLTLTAMFTLLLTLALLIPAFIPTGARVLAAKEETLTAPFINGPNGATTADNYTGRISISVSGTGQAAGLAFSDAFYLFADGAGNPFPPRHEDDFGLCINNQPVGNYVAIPPYQSDHTYQFSIKFKGKPQTITFGVCDTFTSDNTGSYTITVRQG
jgi:hypothetical protein